MVLPVLLPVLLPVSFRSISGPLPVLTKFLGITDSDGNALFEINSPISLHYSQSLTGGVFIVSPRSILYSTFDGSNPENLYLYKGSRFQCFNTSGPI